MLGKTSDSGKKSDTVETLPRGFSHAGAGAIRDPHGCTFISHDG